jgi:hypothetical protein
MAHATEKSVAEFHKRREEHYAFVAKLIAERPERYKTFKPEQPKVHEYIDDEGAKHFCWTEKITDGLIYHLAPELFEPGGPYGFPK